MLGDNAYGSGYDYEFQRAVFETHPDFLRNTTLWSTMGNHETNNGEDPLPYYAIHDFPTADESGGAAMGRRILALTVIFGVTAEIDRLKLLRPGTRAARAAVVVPTSREPSACFPRSRSAHLSQRVTQCGFALRVKSLTRTAA